MRVRCESAQCESAQADVAAVGHSQRSVATSVAGLVCSPPNLRCAVGARYNMWQDNNASLRRKCTAGARSAVNVGCGQREGLTGWQRTQHAPRVMGAAGSSVHRATARDISRVRVASRRRACAARSARGRDIRRSHARAAVERGAPVVWRAHISGRREWPSGGATRRSYSAELLAWGAWGGIALEGVVETCWRSQRNACRCAYVARMMRARSASAAARVDCT